MAPRRKKKSEPSIKPPEIKIGDRVVIIAEGAKKGQRSAVLEIDAEENMVRLTAFGWHKRSDVEVLDGAIDEQPPAQAAPSRRKAAKGAAGTDAAAQAAGDAEERGEFQTLIDGKDAKVVLDGKTGALIDEPLIKPSLDDLVRSLARAHEALEQSTLAKKRATEQCKDDQGAVNAIVAEIIEHYGHATQLSLNINGAAPAKGARPDADDDEDDDEEEEEGAGVPAGAGARGGVREYSGGEGPE